MGRLQDEAISMVWLQNEEISMVWLKEPLQIAPPHPLLGYLTAQGWQQSMNDSLNDIHI